MLSAAGIPLQLFGLGSPRKNRPKSNIYYSCVLSHSWTVHMHRHPGPSLPRGIPHPRSSEALFRRASKAGAVCAGVQGRAPIFVEGMPWCKKIVDNILIWASNPSELESRINQVVQWCEDLHVTLSRSKFYIDSTLKFAGCVVSASGVTPDPDRIFLLWQSFRLLLTRLQ